jgi:hypothetical protein
LAHEKCGEELNHPVSHVDIGGGGLDQAWLRRIIAPPCTPETTQEKKNCSALASLQRFQNSSQNPTPVLGHLKKGAWLGANLDRAH